MVTGYRLRWNGPKVCWWITCRLQAAGHLVFPVSPRIAARARERYKVASVKDDRFDAFVLADTLRF